ncbi:MAG: heavy metal translocating P-type ATPase, partial [Anaerolineae bacterium]|nr:heavy metal translocating P-type ATPase [Anaerolineae bacterium]
LVVEVTRLAKDNTLSRIIQMVAEAQGVRAPSQRMIDQFATWYTPSVVALAAGVAFIPPLLFGQPFYDTPDGHGWLYRALAMLVIACPCALVISTPVTVISAITAAARRGVLIKGGKFLEALGGVKVFAFDKTGTLTAGEPRVVDYHAIADHAAACSQAAPCAVCDDVLALASAVERRASHPLATAVANAANERHLETTYAAADGVETLAGRGVRGQVAGHTVTIGSHSLFDEQFPHSAALCQEITSAEANGKTTMLLAQDDDVRGYISLVDVPRGTSKGVISDLNALDTATVMLTGDNRAVAEAVGGAVGVTEVRAQLLPEDKVAAVKELREKYEHVAMVGDGINDTPALAAATVGIAMGGAGSPQALETADIALMADDLTQLPYVVRLSRFARSLIKQNVAFSFGVKLVFLVLAFFGLTSLWIAILADVGMSLLVTLNGMRPLRYEVEA